MNQITIEELNNWLKNPEGLNLEFKEAKNQFDKDRNLPDYCAGIANSGGGKLILGVNNSKEIVGSNAFKGTHQKLSHELFTKIRIRIDIEELFHPKGRVLVFIIPSRSLGQIVISTGKYKYPIRLGESLIEMDQMTIKRILNEVSPDFSSQIVPGLSLSDLDEDAINNFRINWAKKSKRDDYLSFDNMKMLESIGLLSSNGLNYTSLILFGKKNKIDELFPGDEIIYEWRQDSKAIAADFRKSWREPFFKIYDDIWKTINDRNLNIQFQDGLFKRDIFAFNESTIREALLNAVAHRDYTIVNQSIFLKVSPEEVVIESPGGFPLGITPENILYKTSWRNRCIAETFEKAGLVERSGQGMDDIFEDTIKDGKGLPDLSKSDEFAVILKIPAKVKDKNFVLFLEKITNEKQITLSFEEIFELEQIRQQKIITQLRFKDKFVELGLIEKVGKTRGVKYILSHQYYKQEGKPGIYTRLIGISRDKQKEFIINHLQKNKKGVLRDFQDIFPELTPMDISNLLQELKNAGRIAHEGSKKTGYWIFSK